MKNKILPYTLFISLLALWLFPAVAGAQTVSLTFRGETLSEALRQIDHAQSERRILFLFDDLEMYTVTAVIDRLPAADAVRRVCRNFPVAITEVGNDIFVEYVPRTVHLNPVVVDGERIPLPALLLADSVPDSLAVIRQYASHIVYFNRVCPQEKVYLHLDNTAYFQGETIWYAAHVVGATTGATPASRVLYVELLSPTGVILQQQKLKIVDGRCHGSFPLVDGGVKAAVDLRGAISYPSGYYQIRAYTRAQLNFDEAAIFSRVIPVYRQPEQEGYYDDPVIADYEGRERDRPDLPRSERPSALDVTFFPEGGHLIEGIPCRIAFKVTDAHGMGTEVDAILDAAGKAIPTTFGGASAPLTHKGMGAITCTPGRVSDRLTFIKEGHRYTFTLPAAESTGCAIRLDALADDSLRIAIEGRGLQKKTLPLGYTITTGGRVAAADAVHFTSATVDGNAYSYQARLSFPKADMGAGVHQFTLFTQSGAILAQRLFFIDKDIPTIPVTVQCDKPTLQPFDSVNLRLRVSTKPVTLSLAVRDAADYGTAYRDDIRTYMLLSSELKGLIEEPGWYFESEQRSVNSEQISEQRSVNSEQIMDKEPQTKVSSDHCSLFTDHSRLQALDVLMMVQGWTRYNWQQMAGLEPFKVRHYTEGQLVLDGWAFSRILERPLKNAKITARLYSPDRKYIQWATVTTDSLGYWSIGLDDFEGDWDLFLSSRQASKLLEKATTRIRFERASRPKVQPFRPEDIFLPDYKNPYPAIFPWQKDNMPKVQIFSEPTFNPGNPRTYQLEEVVIEGKRRYIDYNRFTAFDADKDTEMDLDEGGYTHDVAGYLESKGYSLLFHYSDIYKTGPGRTGTPGNLSQYHNSETGINPFVGITTVMPGGVTSVEVEGHRTRWKVQFPDSVRRYEKIFNEWKRYYIYTKEGEAMSPFPTRTNDNYWLRQGMALTSTSSWDLDMEYVKSVLVFDYEPGHRYVEVIINMKSVDELKQKTKNARHTTFTGYTPTTEFYAPRYPKGPIEGDTDYRRTLYWNPEVTTDSTGCATVSFYNNGYSRALTISAEGLTPEGIPIINQ